MFMKERIIAFCAALLMMLQCCIAGASELKKEPDMLLTNERTWDIRNAQYTIFAKPPVGWVGDVMPMVGDEDSGELRLFYLQDWRDGKPTYHPFHSFTTSDFVHYTYNGEDIPVTNINHYDMALGTGSVTKVGDTYHAFYTGNNPHFYNQGKPREYIRHAISTDGLQSFVKMEKETFTMDQDDGYNRHDFRDPYLFWNEEGQEWWLLITAVKDNRGVVARYRSQDLNHWEKMEPLCDIRGGIMECPDLFKWGDYWYLVYSTDWTTRYLRAESLEGPWVHPPMTAFDSHGFYAAKTGVLNGKRYLCGWIGTRGGYSGEFKDTSEWDWAGNLAVFELVQDEEGWLKVKLPETIRTAFGEPVPMTYKVIDGTAEAQENDITIIGDKNGGGVTFGNLPDGPVLISTTVVISKDARAAGFFFGGDNFMKALAVELNMKHEQLRYDNSLVARMRYVAEASYISRDINTSERTYQLDILIDNDIAVFFLDGREALSTRIYKMPQMPWGFYVADGTAVFQNITMRMLKG